MTARYEVLEPTFIAPHVLHAGSIIETTMEPGGHFRPLNEEAEAAMEDWYNKEHPEKDKDGKLTGNMFRPNADKRPVEADEAPRASVVLISNPPKETAPLQSLAEALAGPATRSDAGPDAPLVAVGETGTDDGETTIVSAAPAPKVKE